MAAISKRCGVFVALITLSLATLASAASILDAKVSGDLKYENSWSSDDNNDIGSRYFESYKLGLEKEVFIKGPLVADFAYTDQTSKDAVSTSMSTGLRFKWKVISISYRSEASDSSSDNGTLEHTVSDRISITLKLPYNWLPDLIYTQSGEEGTSEATGPQYRSSFSLREDLEISSRLKITTDYNWSLSGSSGSDQASETIAEKVNVAIAASLSDHVDFDYKAMFSKTTNVGNNDAEAVSSNWSDSAAARVKPYSSLAFSYRQATSLGEDMKKRTSVSSAVNYSGLVVEGVKLTIGYQANQIEDEVSVAETFNEKFAFGFRFNLFEKVRMAYRYNESSSTDKTGQLKTILNNGVNMSYNRKLLDNSNLDMNFKLSSSQKANVTERSDRNQELEKVTYGVDGKLLLLGLIEIGYGYSEDILQDTKDNYNRSTERTDLSGAFKYELFGVFPGNVGYRSSLASTTSKGEEPNMASSEAITNSIGYRWSDLAMSWKFSDTTSENEVVQSRRSHSPSVAYVHSDNTRVAFSYKVSDRVDEDFVTREVQTSRSEGWSVGLSGDFFSDVKYRLALTHTNLYSFDSPVDDKVDERMSGSLSFKF